MVRLIPKPYEKTFGRVNTQNLRSDMKRHYLLLLLSLLWLGQSSYAQPCPPPGFPEPGNTCAQAPILCDNLDGYCSTINNNNVPQSFPGCGGMWQLNNDEWFAFFAGSTSISIVITPSNCSQNGNNQGLQGGIYAGCGPPWTVMDVQCSCTTQPFTLNSNNFVVGQVYWVVLDGCAGNVCDYTVDVTVGSTVGVPPNNPGAINGPVNACQGTSTNYNTPPVTGATIYNWTVTPPLGTVTGNNNNATVAWGNTPGTAEVCLTVANLCYPNTTPSCQTVTVVPTPTAMLSGSGLLCSGNSPPGSVNLTVNFTGTPPWNLVYAINGTPQPPIQTSNNPYTLVINQPGTVTLTSVSSATGNCPGTVSGSATITQVQLNPTATTVAATCNQSNGSINLAPAGGQAPYTFNWSNGATTEDLQNIAPGSYTVTITESMGCTGTLTVTVANQANEPTISSTTTPSTCELTNGIINLSVSGGATPYTFNWSNGSILEDINNLMAGSYTVTVTGADGCTATSTISLTNNNPPITINGSMTANTTCNGGNGGVTTTVAPSPPPGGGSYTYIWSNGETTPNLANLTPGSYTVTVDGGGACTQTATFTIPDQPNTPNLASTTTPSTCEEANGDINLSVSGGVSPYTFNWSNGDMTEDLNDVFAGSYSVTVTGSNGCTSTASVSLTNNNPPINVTASIVANTTCTGGNGSITASVSPVTPPGGGTYTYNWSNGDTGTNLTNLTPGSYTVTVDGGGACTQTATFTVPNLPNEPTISQIVTPATCGLSNGSVNLSVSGGVSPYTYNWSNGSILEDLTNVSGGSYSVTVTGANGCTASTAISVPDNPVNFTVTSNILPNTSCAGGANNGSINISVTPSGTYTYTWSNGDTGTSLTGLAPGTYTVTVSAGGTCTQSAAFTVPNQPNIPSLSSNITPATCGQSNGGATILTNGGIGPFTYNWTNGNVGQSLTNVPAGSYSVTVTGSNGCTADSSVNIPNNNIPITITPLITPNTSCSSGNGGISISVSPPNTTITWSNGATGTSLTNLDPGTYTVTVNAGGTCVETATFTVPDDSEEPGLSITPTPSSCNLPNGEADLSITGGLAPFDISWSNGFITEDLTNLMAGTYSVIVTSASGCISTATVNVPNNDPIISVNGLTAPNTSCGFPNGGIGLTVTPPANYTYLWSNGETTDYLDNIEAGIYSVTVDGGGTCIQFASFEVFEFTSPPSLSYTASPATCGQTNGSINLSVVGIALPYTYVWSNGSTTEDLNNIAPGTYTVVVTDGNSCTASASATVGTNAVPINITGTTTANTSCSGANGGVNISINPVGTYTYTWSNSAVTEDLNNITAGNYTVTVSAGGSCTATATFTVANQTQNPVITESITAAICGESNGAIDLTITGATQPYTFMWSNSGTTEDITNLAPGDYTVIVGGVNGCSSTAIYNVPNNSSNFSLTGTAQPINTCVYDNGVINLNISPAGSYDILWSNGATTEDIDSLSAGTYTVVVTESGACSASASFTITNTTTLPTTAQTITAALCGQNDGAVDLTVNGGTAPYTFAWSNGAITEDLNAISAGTYTVVVTGANGCTASASASVPDNSITYSVNGTTGANTSCDINNGSIDVTVTPSATYTFVWSNGETTEDLAGLSAGSYTVTVSAGGTCTSEATFNVSSTTADPVFSQTVTAAVCGISNGAINLNLTGGAAPYSFVWSNGATSEDISNLAPGNYSVEVTGSNGCAATGSFVVPNNSVVLSVNGTASANTSCDNINGSVNINVTPSGTYNYIWSNSETTEDLSGLAPGSYTVTVTQGLTCTAEAGFTVGNNTNAPDISPNITAANCGGDDGSINLTATGGTMPYTFTWSNGDTTEDIGQVPGGNYAVTVTGADGCSNTGNYSVPDNLLPINITGLPAQNTACSGGNGSIDIDVQPAWAYTFLWSNGDQTEDLTGLPGGSYEVTVSAGGTCTSVSSFTVPDNPNVPSLAQSITASICGAPDGAVDLTVSGGAMPYSFDWSNGAVTEDLDGVVSGNYSVVVIAANGCTVSGNFNVPNNSNTFTFSGIASANTFCDSGNGTVDLTVVPPGSYSFIWSDGEITEDIGGLMAGAYSVTVSDGGNCTASADFTVGNNAPTINVSGTATDVLCFEENSGAINLTSGGGVAPYTYVWLPGIPGNPEDPTALPAGNYSVVVTDASGCTGTASFSIGQPASAVQLLCTQSGNVSLPGEMDGQASVNITGGVVPYTVVWMPGGSQGNVLSGVFTIDNLGEGNYGVEVTDANGCVALCDFTMTTDDCVTAIGSMQTDLLSACGMDCITGNYNGSGQYLDTDDLLQFILHQGDGNQIVNEIIRSDQPVFCFDPALMSYGTTYYISAAAGNDDGTGNVLLVDACTKITLGTPIVFYEIPVASVNQPAPITCINAQVDLTGSSSVSGSAFSWSTLGGNIVGNPSQTAIQAGAGGFYTLIVSANGCKDTVTVEVTDLQTQVDVSIIASPGEILDCVISQIQLVATATGANNTSYAWLLNGNPVSTAGTLIADASGIYLVIVTDQDSGCSGAASIEIEDNSDFPPLFVNTPAQLNCKDTLVTVSGGSVVNGVQFLWATVSGTDTTIIGQGSSVPVDTPGTYYLIGIAPNGCDNAEAVTVNANFTTPNVNAGQDQVLDCIQTPVGLAGTGSPGVTFVWTADDPAIVISNPAAPGITVNEAGTYTLTVTDLGNYCTDSDDVEVFQYENVPQGVVTAEPPSCYGDGDGVITVETDPDNGPYQYVLNGQNNGGNNVFAPLDPGYYALQVTDGQGCVWTTEVYLPEPEQLTVTLGDDLLVKLGESATLQALYNVPASQLDTILWTPSELFPCRAMPCDEQEFFPTQQMGVEVTIIDTNGCEASDILALFVKKERNVYVPNSFSPNGDGANDVFTIYGGKDVVNVKSFLVFDRWGETVYQYYNFEPNNPAHGWDGTHRGETMNPAVFVWFAVVEFIDGKEELFEGDVTLMK